MTVDVDVERAVEADEIIVAVRRYGVRQRDIATVAHVTDRAVNDWARSRRVARDESYDRLIEIRDLVILLKDSLSDRGVSQWLRARNRLLEGRRPLDVLAERGFEEVRVAAQAFVDGVYL